MQNKLTPDEINERANIQAEENGLDYRVGDLIVSLIKPIEVTRASFFECSHIPGNFRKLTDEELEIISRDS